MPLVNAESGGFHFFASSSAGKTTALRVTSSVMSDQKSYVKQWRATANGLETVLAQHNHALLPLDEIAQADPRGIGEIIYTIGTEKGKIRMNKGGAARLPYEWQLLFLSSGEGDIKSYMDKGGTKIRGGQMVRCLHIPADAGGGYKLFENIHGMKDGSAFAMELNGRVRKFYGTAFPSFIGRIVNDANGTKEKLQLCIRTFEKEVEQEIGTVDVSGEILRGIQRFALVAAGIASRLEIGDYACGVEAGDYVL